MESNKYNRKQIKRMPALVKSRLVFWLLLLVGMNNTSLQAQDFSIINVTSSSLNSGDLQSVSFYLNNENITLVDIYYFDGVQDVLVIDNMSVTLGSNSSSPFVVTAASTISNAVVKIAENGNPSNFASSGPFTINATPPPSPTLFNANPPSTTSGSTIQLIGSNLNFVTELQFNGLTLTPSLDYFIVNPSQIDLIVPTLTAGNYTIQVSNGINAPSSLAFEITAPTVGSASVVSIFPTEEYNGYNITLTGSGFTTVTRVDFLDASSSTNSTFGAGLTILDDNTMIVNVPELTYGFIQKISLYDNSSNLLGEYTGTWRGLGFEPSTFSLFATPPEKFIGGDVTNFQVQLEGYPRPGNVLTVELSDANGNFANPTLVKLFPMDANMASFAVTIPSSLPFGTQYLFRASTSLPIITTVSAPINLAPEPAKVQSVEPLIASVGATVTVIGEGFYSITGVVFPGGFSASYTPIDLNTFTLVVPSGAGSGIVLVQTAVNSTSFVMEVSGSPVTRPIVLDIQPRKVGLLETLTLTGLGFDNDTSKLDVYISGMPLQLMQSGSRYIVAKATVPFESGLVEVYNALTNRTGTLWSSVAYTYPGGSFNSGSFSSGPLSLLEDRAFNTKVLDLDFDSKPEIVVEFNGALGHIQAYKYLGTGSGLSLTTVGGAVFDNGSSGFNAFGFADFDNDGRKDMLSTDGSNPKIIIYKNITPSPGNLLFAGPTTIPFPTYQVRDPYLFDFDQDGRTDVLYTTSELTSTLYVLRNISVNIGIFAFDINSITGFIYGVDDINITDFDGDGKPDIVAYDVSNSASVVYLNTSSIGNISFNPSGFVLQSPLNLTSGSERKLLAVGDLNGDGKVDVLTPQTNSFYYAENKINSAGSYAFRKLSDTHPSIASDIGYLYLKDLDGDGRSEVIRSSVEDSLQVFKTSTPPFVSRFLQTPSKLPSSGPALDLVQADFSGDGIPDLLSFETDGTFSNGFYRFLIHNGASGSGVLSITAFVPTEGFVSNPVTVLGSGFSSLVNVLWSNGVSNFVGNNYTIVDDNTLIFNDGLPLSDPSMQLLLTNSTTSVNSFIDFGLTYNSSLVFNPNKIVVLKVGDGVNSLSNTTRKGQLLQYDRFMNFEKAGSISDLNPNSGLSFGGELNALGKITNYFENVGSPNNKFLVHGYRTVVGSDLSLSQSSLVPKFSQSIDVNSQLISFNDYDNLYITNPPADVVYQNAKQYWSVDEGGKIYYSDDNTADTKVLYDNGDYSFRDIEISNNEWYVLDAEDGIYKTNVALPTTTISGLVPFLTISGIGIGKNQFNSFAFSPTQNRLLLCDMRKANEGGGIYMFTASGSGFELAYKYDAGEGVAHLLVDWTSEEDAMVYYSSAGLFDNKLERAKLTTTTGTLLSQESAGANYAFRGLSWSPNTDPATLRFNGQITSIQTSRAKLFSLDSLPLVVNQTGIFDPNGLPYLMQISDAGGTFGVGRTLNIGSYNPLTQRLTAFIPETLPSGTGYRIRLANVDENYLVYADSIFTITQAPVLITTLYNSTTSGSVVTLFGLNFVNVGFNQLFFNGVESTTFTVITDEVVEVTLPPGDLNGLLSFVGPNFVRAFPWLTPQGTPENFCPFATILPPTVLGDNFVPGDQLNIVVEKINNTPNSEQFDLEFSNEFGFFDPQNPNVLTSFVLGANPERLAVTSTVPTNAVDGGFYAVRLRNTSENCVSFPSDLFIIGDSTSSGGGLQGTVTGVSFGGYQYIFGLLEPTALDYFLTPLLATTSGFRFETYPSGYVTITGDAIATGLKPGSVFVKAISLDNASISTTFRLDIEKPSQYASCLLGEFELNAASSTNACSGGSLSTDVEGIYELSATCDGTQQSESGLFVTNDNVLIFTAFDPDSFEPEVKAAYFTCANTGGVVLDYIEGQRKLEFSRGTVLIQDIEIESTATGISVDNGTLRMGIKFTPEDAADKRIRWWASDTLLGNIDSTGLVTARNNGVLTIYAQSLADTNLVDELDLEITNQFVPVEGMYIYPDDSTRFVSNLEAQVYMNAIFTPKDATDQRIEWKLVQAKPYVSLNVEDSLNVFVEINEDLEETGVFTLLGTSLSNTSITGQWVFTVIGKVLQASEVINTRPVASASNPNGDENPCKGHKELFIDTGAKNFSDFQWFKVLDDKYTFLLVGANKASYIPVASGKYFVRALSQEELAVYEFQTFDVSISGILNPQISLSGVNNAITLTGDASLTGYQWYVNNLLVDGESESTLPVLYRGAYYAIAESPEGCRGRSNVVSVTSQGLANLNASNLKVDNGVLYGYRNVGKGSIQSYPNPAEESLTISYESEHNYPIQVYIMDSFGKVVYEHRWALGISAETIDVRSWSSGIYILKIQDLNVVKTLKISKK